MDNKTRQLPSDPVVERHILGAILINPDLFPQVAEVLKASDFFINTNIFVFNAMSYLHEHGEPITETAIVSVNPDIKYHTLCEITDGMPRLENLTHEIKLVREYSIRRRLFTYSEKYQDMLLVPEWKDHFETYEKAIDVWHSEARILFAGNMPDSVLSQAEYIAKRSDKRYKKEAMKLVRWHLLSNRMSGGLFTGRMYIISARPGGGKTSFFTHMVWQLAQSRFPGLVISLENSEMDTLDKLYAAACEVDSNRLFTYEYTDNPEVMGKMARNATLVADYLSFACERMNVERIVSLIMAYRKQKGIRWVAIDYLQFIDKTNPRHNQLESIGHTIDELKKTCMEQDIACILLSQANRDAEGNSIGMKNMKGSGDIEQVADCILAIQPSGDENAFGCAPVEIKILKNRFGPVGSVKMIYNKPCGIFEEV